MNAQFPLWWASLFTIGLFLLIAILVWLIPIKEVLSDAPDKAGWRDLRLWASALIAVQLMIYYLFS